jgi:hypothetical protein
MESIHIRQRLRPVRYLFLMKSDDFATAVRVASINTTLWGGIYNPIGLIEREEECAGLIREFDPDVIVNLSDAETPPPLAARYEWRVVKEGELIGEALDGSRRLSIGFGMWPLLHHIQEKALSTVPKVIMPLVEGGAAWRLWALFSFGSFEPVFQGEPAYQTSFQRFLKAEEVRLNPATSVSTLIDRVTPIQVTTYGLQLNGGSANFSSHIIYIGDHTNFVDLVEFWNLRATGRRVYFVPAATYRAHLDLIRAVALAGRYQINPQVENHADVQRAPSISVEDFNAISTWISEQGMPEVAARTWGPRWGVEIDKYVGDIHVSYLEGERGEELSLLQDGRLTPIKLVTPKYLSDWTSSKGDYRWAADLTMSGAFGVNDWTFSLPNEATVERLAARSFGMLGESRIGTRGLVVLRDTGSGLYMSPIRTTDVFAALFEQVGLRPSVSEPGRYADQIIRKMGMLQYDCRIFKLRGVRDVIGRLSNGSVLTKGNMHDIVTKVEPDQCGRNWRPELYQGLFVRPGDKDADFGKIFDLLLKHRVIRPGFTFKCPNCLAEAWYHVSEFSEDYGCRFCFTTQRVNFGSKKEWQYKADGLFQIPDSAQGSLAVIVSLWRLNEVSHTDEGRYVTSTKLVDSTGGAESELDYAYLRVGSLDTSYELVLGEARGFVDYDEGHLTTVRRLAAKFGSNRKICFAFSTLKDTFSESEKQLLKTLVDEGHKIIALTREELDPYSLFERFKAARNPYVHTFAELAANTAQLNLS